MTAPHAASDPAAPPCGFPMWDDPSAPGCVLPPAHAGPHDTNGDGHVTYTYTACWQEHEPGTRCIRPIGHDAPPPADPAQTAKAVVDEALAPAKALVADLRAGLGSSKPLPPLHPDDPTCDGCGAQGCVLTDGLCDGCYAWVATTEPAHTDDPPASFWRKVVAAERARADAAEVKLAALDKVMADAAEKYDRVRARALERLVRERARADEAEARITAALAVCDRWADPTQPMDCTVSAVVAAVRAALTGEDARC